MADTKVSALTAAGALTGPEIVPVVQGGASKRTTAAAIAALGLPRTLAANVTIDLATFNVLFKTANSTMSAVVQGPVSLADWETFAPNGYQGFVALGTDGNGGGASFVAVDFSNGATGPGLFLNKTRGTAAVPLAVQSGDSLGYIFWGGYDGAALQNPAYIDVTITGAVSAGVVPADMVFYAGGSLGGFVEAGRIKDSGQLLWIGPIGTVPVAVADLPSAATVGAGARAFVTDATATTFASTVAGTGSNKVPVYSDGTNWKIG